MTIRAEESVPAPIWDEDGLPPLPSYPRDGPPPARILSIPSEEADGPGEAHRGRRFGERLADAFPLLAASVACALVGWVVYGQESSAPSREFPIWGLFVALAIIAGMGAGISFMIDDPEPEPAPRRYRRTQAEDSRSGEDAEEMTIDELLEGISRPADRPRTAARPTRAFSAQPRAGPLSARPRPGLDRRKLSSSNPRTEPPLGLEGLETPAPSEAIAEIDLLWTDLERLRRGQPRGRRSPSG